MELVKGNRTAILIEPNSFIGKHTLDQLIIHEGYETIKVFSNRPQKIHHSKLQWHQFFYHSPELVFEHLKGDDLFWCRSSFKDWDEIDDPNTIKKSLPFKFAWEALGNGVNQFILLSSAAFMPWSTLPVFKERSQLEEAIAQLPFWSVHILKAPIVIEDSPKKSFGDQLARRLAQLTGIILDHLKPVEARTVATAMIEAATSSVDSGLYIYPPDHFQKKSKGKSVIIKPK
ncbi:MAG: hypothetical protein AAFO07_17270 [Bacteroidota bacterium]